MEPVHKKLHITLAYVYAHQIPRDRREKLHLKQLAKKFEGAVLHQPLVYHYSTMKDYFLYLADTTGIKC